MHCIATFTPTRLVNVASFSMAMPTRDLIATNHNPDSLRRRLAERCIKAVIPSIASRTGLPHHPIRSPCLN